jgi:hypothetical protein
MSALDFDISPAEEPPRPEATLDGNESPPLEEGVPLVKMEIKDDDDDGGRYSEGELEDIELPDLPKKKPKLTDEEVFAAPKVQPVKKPRKKRAPPTPEQLERLAEARKKAFAVKAAKKKERDEMKVLEQKVAQKKKQKLEQEIIETLDEDELPDSIKQARKYKEKKINDDYQAQLPRTQSVVPSITADDLKNAIAQGVEIYDTRRKAQKKLKKEKQADEQRQKDIVQKVQKAIDPNSYWDQYLR